MTIKFDKDGYALSSGVVNIYHVMPDTREFCGISEEFINIGQGIPAQAYLDAPMGEKIGFAVCRMTNEKSWEYIADHRGEIRYSTISKQEVTIKELGDYPANTTDIAPTQFDMWDGSTWIVDEAAKSAAAIQSATLKKAELIATASVIISPLADAKEDGYIEDTDIPILAAWQKYRYVLTKVDVNNPTWPIAPE